MSWRDLKVGKKIGIGFGIVLALLLIVGGVGYNALKGAKDGFGEYREMARDTNLSGSVQANMLMVRMNVKDFLITGSQNDIDQYNDYFQKMADFLDQAQTEIRDPDRAAKIDVVDENIKDYDLAFDEVIELQGQRDTHVNDILNVQGPQMEKNLTKILTSAEQDNDTEAAYHAALAMRNLLLARLYVIKFLDDNTKASIDRAKQEMAEVQEELQTLDAKLQNSERRRLLALVQESKDKYKESMEAVENILFSRNEIVTNRLDQIGPEVASLIEEVKLDIKGVQDELGPQLEAQNNQAVGMIIIIAIIALASGAALAAFIVRGISRPVSQMAETADKISVGDVQQNIEYESKDEIGVLANSFRNLIEYMKELSGAAAKIADNDLNVRIEPKSEQDVLGNSFKTMIINLTEIVRTLNDNASQLVSAAGEIASSSEEMSRGAQEQSNQVSQVSTAVEEMTATILESSKNASEASDASKGASETATNGGTLVSDTITGMQRISSVVRESSESIGKLAKSADEIGEIIGVIDDIADQTNLLALNAAIEAARAGEQGRGFAVVADEVRKLAERTGKATGEITEMIKGIQKDTSEAVESMETGIGEVDKGRELTDKAGSSLTDIVNMSQQVMDMIQQIATASEEQSAAAEQISKNIESVSAITRQTASGAEQSAAAAEQLNRQAEGLKHVVERFKLAAADEE
jgi:methyl-accepting chemotaxis protein